MPLSVRLSGALQRKCAHGYHTAWEAPGHLRAAGTPDAAAEGQSTQNGSPQGGAPSVRPAIHRGRPASGAPSACPSTARQTERGT